ECDMDAAAAIAYLADDAATRVIGLYLEDVRDTAAFRDALRRAAVAGKPVIAIKAGRSQAGAAAAASHTGALAGDDVLYDACLRQHGALRVDSLGQMIDAARLFLYDSVPRGNCIAVMSVSGGAGVLIAGLLHGTATPFTDAIAQARRDTQRPIVVIWIGAKAESVAILEQARIPVFLDIPPAVAALGAAVRLSALREAALGLPAAPAGTAA